MRDLLIVFSRQTGGSIDLAQVVLVDDASRIFRLVLAANSKPEICTATVDFPSIVIIINALNTGVLPLLDQILSNHDLTTDGDASK